MLITIITACGLSGFLWRLSQRLASAWGFLLPVALMLLLVWIELDMTQLRGVMLTAMLATLVMLFNPHARHYLLLPSCMALAGGLAAISLHFNVG